MFESTGCWNYLECSDMTPLLKLATASPYYGGRGRVRALQSQHWI